MAPASRGTALVTGASSGLGAAVVRRLAADGWNLVLVARRQSRLDALAEDLGRAGVRVCARACDLSNASDRARLIAEWYAFGGVNALVNCAGIQGPIGPTASVPTGAWQTVFEVNVVAVADLCGALVSNLAANARRGKIVNLSGGGATAPRAAFAPYALSKVAVVRYTETLAAELGDRPIDVNAVAPGVLATAMTAEVLSVGAAVAGADEARRAADAHAQGEASLDRAVGLCAWLLSSESDGITGRLLSAVWDPWESLQNHAAELRGSDIYTLRRVVPADRGKTWGNR